MAPSTESSIQLTILNDRDGLALAARAIDGFGSTRGIAPAVIAQLQVIADELLSNIFKYAWDDVGQHRVLLRLTFLTDSVSVEFIDDGKPFDLRIDAPDPPVALPGSRPRPGGVGVVLVKQLADRVEYARLPAGNHVTITKRLTPKKDSA